MAITRSFTAPFEMTDLTEELLLIPNTYGLVNQLGIFRDESVTQHAVTVESSASTLALISDKVRGERNNVNKDRTRNLRSFPIPHFPLDDYLAPEDIQGRRAYGSDNAETQAAVMARKLEDIASKHAVTLEAARMHAITQGAIYAPNGSVVGNYYTDFGVTRKEIAFDLSNSATDVIAKVREVTDHIQENILDGEIVDSYVALCSPEFFDALVQQAGVKEAYKFYQSTQEPLRNGLRDGRYAKFEHAGVTFYRYVGAYKDAAGVTQKLVPANEAYFLPLGTRDTFISYFSPANKLDYVNTLGEKAYVWTYTDPKGAKVEIESEHNALHLIRRPSAIVRAVKGAAV